MNAPEKLVNTSFIKLSIQRPHITKKLFTQENDLNVELMNNTQKKLIGGRKASTDREDSATRTVHTVK